MKNLTAAFIGQRPSLFPWGYDEEDDDCLKLKQLLVEQIVALIDNGVINFVSDMAWGTDLFCAEMVVGLKRYLFPQLQLICVLPSEEQAAKWSPQQRKRYYDTLEHADQTIYMQHHVSQEGVFKCHRWLVEHSHFLLAVHNGAHKGSAYAVSRYAQAEGRAVIVVNPDNLTVEPWTVHDIKI